MQFELLEALLIILNLSNFSCILQRYLKDTKEIYLTQLVI